MSAKADNADNLHDYCSGYLSEVYGTLDPIEDPLIRTNIEKYREKNCNNKSFNKIFHKMLFYTHT